MLVFLFTDIEGSSRLWELHPAAMGQVIVHHDTLLERTIEDAGGRITKHTGDGITAAFDGGDPITCALETLKAFAQEDWGAVGELRIRVGLHAGDAEWLAGTTTGSGDYYGPAVNCAARVVSAAWGGQILLTPAVTHTCPLPENATLRDLGRHLFRNVSDPLQIFQLLHPDLAEVDFPPPCSLSGRAIEDHIRQQGQEYADLSPERLAIRLTSALLLPTLQGDLAPSSAALENNLGLLYDLGTTALPDLVAHLARRRQDSRQVGEPPATMALMLETGLLAHWQAADDTALALRNDTSRLLQAVGGVDAALAASTAGIRDALAQGLASLGSQFSEFRWMLTGVREMLAEVRVDQALQLALQREQLDLQRQQLVKINLLLQRQHVDAALAESMYLAGTGDDMDALPMADLGPAGLACPYKGLAAFEPEDAEFFFGREALVAELAARLAGSRFLAVVGPSGSGKSSIVRAGLLPAMWTGALPGSSDWHTIVLTPGPHPLEELAVRMSLLGDFAPGAVLRDLESDYRCLHLAITGLLAHQPDHVQLLLVVDQFEEVFALCHDERERQQFIDALLCAVEVETSRTLVVPTIRADFYGHCADYPELAVWMRDSLLIGPLRDAELRSAIEKPAAVVGLRLEPGLVETIMGDVANEPGGLPLLSHALVETWERRQGRTLTLAAYIASGGVTGALAQTADMVYGALPPEQQAIARNIFLRLTEFGEAGTQDTRRRVEPAELVRAPEEAPAVAAVLKTLADARLVTTAEDTVEVAHEALIREWPALRGWLEQDREGLRIHRHLTQAATEWARLQRDPGELYRGARLAMACEWAAANGERLNSLEWEFLEGSQALARRREAERQAQQQRELQAERQRAEEQARASRRLRWLVAGLTLVLLLAMGAAWYARSQQQQAQVREAEAVAAQATVVHQSGLITSRHLADQAMDHLNGDQLALDLALLLGVEAVRAEDRAESRSSLLSGLQYSPHLAAFLHGHPDIVTSVAMSPDGGILATGSGDGSIVLWDAARREPRGEPLKGHTSPVTSIAFSPDGKTLVSGSQDKTIMLWDLASGKPKAGPLTGHGDWVTSVAFSPSDHTLATGSYDQTVILWDLDTGRPIGQPLAGHTDWVLSVAFSPDGRTLASGSRDTTIRLWDVASRRGRGEPLQGHTGWVQSLAFRPDGQVLASASRDGTVRLWAMDSGEPLNLPLAGHDGPVTAVVFDPVGQRLASAGHDGLVRLWDGATGAALDPPLRGHTNYVMAVAFGPDGQTVASGGTDGRVVLWDLTRAGVQGPTLAGHDDWVSTVALSPEGKTLASGSVDGVIRRWDTRSGQALGPALAVGAVSSLAFSPDLRLLAAGRQDWTIALWDLEASTTATGGHRLGEPIPGHDNLVTALAFSPDGMTLASGDFDGVVMLWDTASGQPLGQPLLGHGNAVRGLAFSPDGAILASASSDRLIILWDWGAGKAQGPPLVAHTLQVNTVAFNPDGSIVATGSEDGTIVLWDAASGEPLGPPLNGQGDVEAVAFSPDGKMLATGGTGNTVLLWDVASGQRLGQPLSGHSDWVNALAFSRDGQMLASGSSDGTIILWEADTEAWQARACAVANRSLTAVEWKGFLGDQEYRETCRGAD